MAGSKYVFISYSSKDSGEANLITKLLDDAGIAWWKAPEKIPEGSGYAKEIGKAIEDSQVFMLVLSANTLTSIWVEKELEYAVSARKEIIAFNLDETELNDTFRFYLGNSRIILNRGGAKSGPAELIESVKNAVSDGGGTVVKKTFTEQPQNSPQPPMAATTQRQAPPAAAPQSNVVPGPAVPQRKMKFNSVFSMNRIPACCMYCGGPVSYVSEGVFVCLDCNKENYDDYKTIKDYIRANGPCTVTKLANELKIPRNIINSWWEEENRN